MNNDVFTFLVGGKAGEGVKKAGSVASHIFSSMGRHVFQMDDYMSLIRGGHNFSVISTAHRWISSHYMKANLVVNFDKRSCETHVNDIAENGIMIFNSDEQELENGIGIPLTSEAEKYPMKNLMFGVGAVAILAATIGFEKEEMNQIIKDEYPRGIENNIEFASTIYDIVYPDCGNKFFLEKGDRERPIITGNEAISLGAIAGGLDVYYGYPMTPASTILHTLAREAENFGLAVVHAESEIAVINMAIGSAFTGARAMVGTSGGGFALMTEGLSLAGITEAPVLIILSQRPGPATGVPTYTEQADLAFALSAGHGDFLRIVASPTTVREAYYLTAEMLDLVWKFQTPGILLTEKHLSESSMTVEIDLEKSKWAEPKMYKDGNYKRYQDKDDGISPMLFPPSKKIIKWNSYEHDELGITTEDAKKISFMHDKRNKKLETLIDYLKEQQIVKIIRGENNSNIFTYGSTYMSVLEALRCGSLNPTTVAPIYLNPLPIWELKEFKNQDNIVIEQSSTGQFTKLLKEKAGLNVRNTIKKYDGRPFDPLELSMKIKEVLE
ncbi:MAG: 2-oxoacid:ferredoxin oxidoreductase subunit alpha [Promethearchaeota archaeon Loki_b32]|nr:MAG: 2-oxoacid:ferredoxin oxidoreductase subunit alpha [Candidatus Lokiarchaeota archaeon Loki_b32]